MAPMAKVVVTWPLPGDALDALAGHDVEVLDHREPVTAERLRAAVRDADALLCMLTDTISRSLLEAAPGLRVVGVCAVGYDNVDVAAATDLGIQVCNTPNVLTEATADLALALLLRRPPARRGDACAGGSFGVAHRHYARPPVYAQAGRHRARAHRERRRAARGAGFE